MAGADNRKSLSILRAIHFAETAAATLPSQIASGKPISGWVYMRIENTVGRSYFSRLRSRIETHFGISVSAFRAHGIGAPAEGTVCMHQRQKKSFWSDPLLNLCSDQSPVARKQ